MLDTTRQNLRDAIRGLRSAPGAALAVVTLLALGIGANATMFDIIDRLLLRPPDHLVDADRLRIVYAQRPTLSLPQFARNLTYPDIDDLFQQLTTFGAHAVREANAVLKPAEKDRCVSDDFYSTTNHRTHVRLKGRWVEVEKQRMDAVIVAADGRASCRKLRDGRRHRRQRGVGAND